MKSFLHRLTERRIMGDIKLDVDVGGGGTTMQRR